MATEPLQSSNENSKITFNGVTWINRNGALLHRKVEKVDRIAGLTCEAIPSQEMGEVQTHGYYCSNHPEFTYVADQLWNIFIGRSLRAEAFGDFLVVVHADLSADLFVGLLPKSVNVRARRRIEAGEDIAKKDIADIRDLKLINIPILNTDSVVCSFRVGWRFGLWFDFRPLIGDGFVGNVDETEMILGTALRHLLFFEEYEIARGHHGIEMAKEGWFPFIRLLGGEYKELAGSYETEKHRAKLLDSFVDKYDRPRVQAFVDSWWSSHVFASKRKLIEAGIDSYFSGNESGIIAALKILYSEIEGLIRILHTSQTGKHRASFRELMTFVNDLSQKKYDTDSLAFPDSFFKYLQEQIFADFDLETGVIPISRHSSSHGVATSDQYTKIRAFQAILTLDQLFYLLG